MNKFKVVLLTLLIVFSFAAKGVSQQATVSAGGDGSGVGGTLSSSAGLSDYLYLTSSQYSLQFGIQQVYIKTVSIGTSPSQGGKINGGGIYPVGEVATLMALADAGYEFVMWVGNFYEVPPNKLGTQSTNNPITIIVQEDTEIDAIFRQVEPVAVPVSSQALLLGFMLIMAYIVLRSLFHN